MSIIRLACVASAALLFAAACDDGDTPRVGPADAAPDPIDAAAPDPIDAAEEPADAAVYGDACSRSDARNDGLPEECSADGISESGTFGAEGGIVSLCGARVVLQAGDVGEPVTIRLTRYDGFDNVSLFRVTTSAPIDPALWVELPIGPGGANGFARLLRMVDGRWADQSVCLDHDGVVGQWLQVPGDFGTRPVSPWPRPPAGTGAGGLVTDGYATPVDPHGHAVSFVDGPGNQKVLVETADSGDIPVTTNLGFELGLDGAVRLGSFGEHAPSTVSCFYPYQDEAGLATSGTVTLDPTSSGDHYVGTFAVRCYDALGGGVQDRTGSFDVTTVRHPSAPARSCAAPPPSTPRPSSPLRPVRPC